MTKVMMRDGKVVLRPPSGGLSGSVRSIQLVSDTEDPCDAPCDCPCTIECGGVTYPVGFDLSAGTGSGDGCCCDSLLGDHVLLNTTRMFIYCLATDRCAILTGNEKCTWLAANLNDFSEDMSSICLSDVSPPNMTNPHIDSTGSVFRLAEKYQTSGTGSPCCEEFRPTIGNTTFAQPGDSCTFEWTWRLTPQLITSGSNTFVRFTAEVQSAEEIVTYVSDDIPIGADLDARNIGTVQLDLTTVGTGTGTSTADSCDWPVSISLTPISTEAIRTRDILDGTVGCNGEYKPCCQKWGSQVELQVKPLECDIDPEEFILTEVSPAESPRRWTGSAALSCGDTYAVEFVCSETEDECTNKFQLTFTPDCGTTDPLSATITGCTCLEEPPRFTYTASRGVGDSSAGCNCCVCSVCQEGTEQNCYRITTSGFAGSCNSANGCFSDMSVLNGTFDLVSVGPCLFRYTFPDGEGVIELSLDFDSVNTDVVANLVFRCSPSGAEYVKYRGVISNTATVDCSNVPWALVRNITCPDGFTSPIFINVTACPSGFAASMASDSSTVTANVTPMKSRGLGDTVAKFTTATGVKSAVDTISNLTGLPCGCEERQKRLNELFPYG